jgi:hypothetical protein
MWYFELAMELVDLSRSSQKLWTISIASTKKSSRTM